MTGLKPSMRLKVKGDTFFFPDAKGGVYFRNNSCSFRIEGETVDQWMEKLLPMFNGEHTLKDLTDGLPEAYRNRVYEIAEILCQNGFVRDVSEDRPHQLTDEVRQKFALQIEFLDTLADSGASRFESYRRAKVLAVGCGPMLASLTQALLESGLPRLRLLVTGSHPTNRERLFELASHARKTDPEVELEEICRDKEGPDFWREAVDPFDYVLYVSPGRGLDELRLLHAICREEKKVFLPAVGFARFGMAGPVVEPGAEGCWESAWRRLHRNAIGKETGQNAFPSTAGALLANVIVFALFKTVTGVAQAEEKNKLFLLNPDTLEGSWHSFFPHPLVAGHREPTWVQEPVQQLEASAGSGAGTDLFSYFNHLTSVESGIFHVWGEGDLKQLPLSQCRIQAVNPLSDGPAELLPEIICSGLTHEEARREAGLAGVEAYVSQMTGLLVKDGIIQPQEFVGVGAGTTVAEAFCRGLQKCLADELVKQLMERRPVVVPVQLPEVSDERSQFFLQALTTLHGEAVIGLGESVCGFPVVWIGTGGRWIGSAGLNETMALRTALQQAVQREQNQTECGGIKTAEVSSVLLRDQEPHHLRLPSCGESSSQLWQSASQILTQNGWEVFVLDLALEPFLQKALAGVFGVLLRRGETR